jgi:hypothetical protein
LIQMLKKNLSSKQSLPASTMRTLTERPVNTLPPRFATQISTVKTYMGRVNLEPAGKLAMDLAEGIVPPAGLVVLLGPAWVYIDAMAALKTVMHVIHQTTTPVRVAGYVREHATEASIQDFFAPFPANALTVRAATILLLYALLTVIAAPRSALVVSGMELPALSPPTAIQAHAA